MYPFVVQHKLRACMPEGFWVGLVAHVLRCSLHLRGSSQCSGALGRCWCYLLAVAQVISVCKSADLLLMVLDATKPWGHKEILTRELEAVGIRLNR